MSGRGVLLVSVAAVLTIALITAAVHVEALDTVLAAISTALTIPPIIREFWLEKRSSPQTAAVAAASPIGPPPLKTYEPLRPLTAFESGLYGGLIGGALAGVLVGVAYCYSAFEPELSFSGLRSAILETPHFFSILTSIIFFGALSGSLLGAFVQSLAMKIQSLPRNNVVARFALNEISGGALGGLGAGIIIGPAAGWYFGRQYGLPIADPIVVLFASVPGVLIIILSVLGYRTPTINRRLLRDAVLSTVLCLLTFVVLGALASSLGVINEISRYFFSSTPLRLLLGGGYFGTFCGVVFGAGIGVSLLLARRR